ncbi:MAG: biotin--[acetyl-CoA-carboxylase] ligase [Bacillota bacterium]|nr:biotin--[acetyl-CoA-carboxylase] ligase [Bacillota bacterium]
MKVKDQVLALLEEQRDVYLSGAELARRLGVSRAAVWKGVEALREEGFRIDAVSNRGYRLAPGSEVFSPRSIARYLGADSPFQIRAVPVTGSTNDDLKALAAAGAPEGTVLAAEAQTGGKGRLGRSFFAPAGSGVYFSLLLRPRCRAEEAIFITTAAAVAVCEAVEALAGGRAEIKWVNDIWREGRKVCGILTEAAADLESGALEYAVLGIGVNLREPERGFPRELRDVAGALFKNEEPPREARSRLTAEILKRFWAYYLELEKKTFLEPYRKRSLLPGREVLVLRGEESRKALALEVDERCRLLVRYEDGTEEALSSGEVSIRL